MNRVHISAAAALLFSLVGGAYAESPGPTLEVWPPRPDAGTVIRVKVQGEWPNSCTPRISGAHIVGRDIVVEAGTESESCADEPRPYTTSTEKLALDVLKLSANGVYRVRFEVRGDKAAEAELHGFRLLYVGNERDPGYVPETGFWWPERGGEFDRAGPGLGAQMEVQARTLSIMLFGYEADGRASWYVGADPIDGHIAQIALSRLNGGAGPFEKYRAPQSLDAIGTLQFELITPSRATLWFVRPRADNHGLEVQPISMVRFRFAQEAAEAWLGRWVVLAERDDGYPTLRIDFATSKRDKQGFSLESAGGAYRLRCENANDLPNSPPARCVLHDASGDTLDVDFDHVALNELRGWTGAGQRIVALKLNR